MCVSEGQASTQAPGRAATGLLELEPRAEGLVVQDDVARLQEREREQRGPLRWPLCTGPPVDARLTAPSSAVVAPGRAL